MMISAIVAADASDLIGVDNRIPWYISDDLRRFKRLTDGHVVIAGRKTHESIVEKLGHPLPGRTTIVVSRQPPPDQGQVHFRRSVEEAIETAKRVEQSEAFVIGGADIYRATRPYTQRIYFTRVAGTYEGDTWLDPGWLDGFTLVDEEPPTATHQFLTYERVTEPTGSEHRRAPQGPEERSDRGGEAG